MNHWQTFYAIFRKELALQSGSGLFILNRLLIGPVISCVTAGLLYRGFFQADQNLSLGDLNVHNYRALLIFGFLTHNYLNCGYYFFFNRVWGEWHRKTLALLWIAPGSKLMMALAMTSVDLLRCWVLSLIAYTMLNPGVSFSLKTLVLELLLDFSIFLLGLSLGLLKTIIFLTWERKAELMDNFYLAFVFTGCLYIPAALLPTWIASWCQFNPIGQGLKAMVQTWQLGFVPLGPVAYVISWVLLINLICGLGYRWARSTIEARVFS